MKNMQYFSRRGLAMLLALVMCLGMLQITAFADEPCPECKWTGGNHDSSCSHYVAPSKGDGKEDSKEDPEEESKEDTKEESKEELKDEEPQECSHQWTNGKCDLCGEHCSHNYADGWCTICKSADPNHKHSYDETGKCVCGDEHTTHTVTNWTPDHLGNPDLHVGKCSVCGQEVKEAHTFGSVQGGRKDCTKCGYYTFDTPGCEHVWQYSSDGKGEMHTLTCLKCGEMRKDRCELTESSDGSKQCELCGWNNKDIVNPTRCLKCDGDHKTEDCPNWCAICDQPYLLAQCGGKYCVVNGMATHIIKGTSCRDNMNGFESEAPHDHQCDFCHAHHLDLTVEETTATCTQSGHTTVKCGYPNCNYVESEKDVGALGHTFEKAYVSDNCKSHSDADCETHTLTCSRCGGKEGKDAKGQDPIVIEPHSYDKGVPATVNGEGGTKYTCTVCEHWYFVPEVNKYTLTINYVYDDTDGIFATYTDKLAEGQEYKVESKPAPEGYAFAAEGIDEVKTGVMPGQDLTIKVSYKPITYTQTIKYVIAGEDEPFETTSRDFTINTMKKLESVVSPAKEGYTVDVASVPAPDKLENTTVTVTYTPSTIYKLVVNHEYVAHDGTRTVVTETLGEAYKVGDPYTTTATNREGYTLSASPENASGTFDAIDVTVTYVYNEDTFTVTWLPGYGDNSAIATGTYGKVTQTENYRSDNPADPARGGYTFTGWGTPVTGEDGNITITAQWSQNSTGGGTGGGGGGGTPPTTNPDPTPDEPDVDVPDPDVPLTDLPDEDVPLANIPEEEVPLAETPEEVEIPEEDVPLANVPRTGDISALWYLTTLLSAGILAFLGLRRRDRH